MNTQPFNAQMVSGVEPMQADIATHFNRHHYIWHRGGKAVDPDFDGGRLSSDAGMVQLKDIDDQLGLTHALAAVLSDPRDARPVKASQPTL